jgi:hypothetical protein
LGRGIWGNRGIGTDCRSWNVATGWGDWGIIAACCRQLVG